MTFLQQCSLLVFSSLPFSVHFSGPSLLALNFYGKDLTLSYSCTPNMWQNVFNISNKLPSILQGEVSSAGTHFADVWCQHAVFPANLPLNLSRLSQSECRWKQGQVCIGNWLGQGWLIGLLHVANYSFRCCGYFMSEDVLKGTLPIVGSIQLYKNYTHAQH